MKKILFYGLLITLYLLLAPWAHADYVLPYPSYMPGNTLYKISRVFDLFKKYWYFGNIAQVKYHLGLSDKYLVEAKTLFEYNQYLLGTDALGRSDREFSQIPNYIRGTGMERNVGEAAQKHIEVLTGIHVPIQFTWRPEKAAPMQLPLGSMIQSSIELREHVASDAASL